MQNNENNSIAALSVRYSELSSLPESIGQLTNITLLDVAGNQLTSLPESLGNLHHLKKVYLDPVRHP